MRPFVGCLLLLAALLPGGCVIIPYVPARTVVDGTPLAGDVRLGAGPRCLLADYTDAVAGRDARLQAVDAVTARDLLFGDGRWTMAALLDAPRGGDCGLDYVVVIAPPVAHADEWGLFTFYLGFFGLDSNVLDKSMQVVVVDVQRARPLACLQVAASGRQTRLGVFFALWIEPLVDVSLRRGVAEAVVAALAAARPEGGLRFAFLAAAGARS